MKNSLEELLRQNKSLLQTKFKVKEIGFFGSIARGDYSPESDVDVLVEFSAPVGWEFFELKEFLENLLQRKVDLMTVRALKDVYREKVLNEVVYP